MTLRRVLTFAGPNGSGKSSVIKKIQAMPNFPEIFLGPDEVVKMTDFRFIEPIEDRYAAAMTFCENVRKMALLYGESVAFETVFSTEEKLNYLKEARKEGYVIEVVFVTTVDPEINKQRVAKRVSEGGHDVPPDKVVSRYHRSMALLPQIFAVCDSFALYDNSGEAPKLNMFYSNRHLYALNKDIWPAWLLSHPLWQNVDSLNRINERYELDSYETNAFLGRVKSTKLSHHLVL